MKIENSGTLATASGSKFTLQTPVEFEDYQVCDRIRVEVSVPISNPTGGTLAIAKADYLSLYQKIFAQFTLAFGDEIVDNAMPYDRARELHSAMTQRDMAFVSYGGTSGQLVNFTTENILTLATGTVKLEFTRPFNIERLGGAQGIWRPGASQMRSLKLFFQRGAAWSTSGGVVEDGSASVSVIFDSSSSPEKDVWARVPRLYTTETGGLTGKGPDGGGGMLMLYHYNAAASTNGGGLGAFSLSHDGESVHDQIDATRVVRDSFERQPLGAMDLNTLVTVLFEMPSAFDLPDLQVGGEWQFRQVSRDLDPPKLGWIHIPPTDGFYRDRVMQPLLISDARPEVKVVNAPAFSGERVPLQHTSIAPMVILEPSHPAYPTVIGRRFVKGQAAQTHIPVLAVARIKKAVEEAGDAGADTYVRAIATTAAIVPGGASPERGTLTDTTAAISAYIDPASVSGSVLANKFSELA